MGSKTGQALDSQHMEQLLKQNNFLKNLLSKIAPGIGPMNARRKRSTEEASPTRRPKWKGRLVPRGGSSDRTGVVCARPSPICRPRGQKRSTTTPRPIYPPPLLGDGHKPSECVLNYFAKALQTSRGSQPRSNDKILGLSNILGK